MFYAVKKMDERLESPIKLLFLNTSFKNHSLLAFPSSTVLKVEAFSSWDGLSFERVYVHYSGERKPLAILKLMVLLHLHIKGTDFFFLQKNYSVWDF